MRQIGDGIRIGGGIRILFSKPFMYSLRKTAYTCNGKEVDNKINTIFMFTVAPAAYISLLHDKININPYIGACISFHSIRNSVHNTIYKSVAPIFGCKFSYYFNRYIGIFLDALWSVACNIIGNCDSRKPISLDKYGCAGVALGIMYRAITTKHLDIQFGCGLGYLNSRYQINIRQGKAHKGIDDLISKEIKRKEAKDKNSAPAVSEVLKKVVDEIYEELRNILEGMRDSELSETDLQNICDFIRKQHELLRAPLAAIAATFITNKYKDSGIIAMKKKDGQLISRYR